MPQYLFHQNNALLSQNTELYIFCHFFPKKHKILGQNNAQTEIIAILNNYNHLTFLFHILPQTD
jgi:hypothetical protein